MPTTPDVGLSRDTRRFSLVLVIVLLALVGVQVVGVQAQRGAVASSELRVRLAGDVQQIRYYDELLTMSARLAAASGDDAYVQRYRKAVPQLDAVLADALTAVPDERADQAVRDTDAANKALISLEQLSFDRLATGDRTGAYEAVTSKRYEQYKKSYREGMDVALSRLEGASRQSQDSARERQKASLTLSIVSAALLGLLWLLTARGLRRSQRARATVEDQLRQQAHADPLTGLANRRLFRARLDAALLVRGPGDVAVIFADLDHFKRVNDTRGHAEGDALLIEVAQRLRDLTVGAGGSCVARLGGDEFALLLRTPSEAALSHFADRLVQTLGRSYASAGQTPVSASVGVATALPGERDPGVLLRGADLAMYDAKERGRARWSRYVGTMHSELMSRVALQQQLREGIRRGELVVHYQPVFDLVTGRPHSVEALVRWEHPERGLLLPGEFVPLAEDSDVIADIGAVVLKQACAQLARWTRHDVGGPAEVSVNVSPQELERPGFAAGVLAALDGHALDPRRLVLELTESTVMSSGAHAVAVLSELRAAGVRVAIDDFGTGHSSLARLHALPVDRVKIDRSFVLTAAPDEAASPGNPAMLELIVGLADRLGLDLVAEGIETERQAQVVRAAGCTLAQGFLLARPAADAWERATAAAAVPRQWSPLADAPTA